jgi:hypothetical protein
MGFVTVFAVIGLAALARVAVGERASFIIEILLSGIMTTVTGFATGALVRSARDQRLNASNRRIVAAIAVVPGAFALFFGVQAAQLLADAILPFDRVDTIVLAYRSGSGGRLPSHAKVVTTSGTYDLPFLMPHPAGLSEGRHVLVVTHFNRLVVDVLPDE